MHEMSTCRQLIKQIEGAALDYPDKKISAITLTVGELARVDINELIALFPLASQGTRAEHAKLLINKVPINIKCQQCHKSADVSAGDMSCPFCGSENTQLMAGTDMQLEALEFV